MEQKPTVMVFNFRSWDDGAEMARPAAYKATREWIHRTPGNDLLEGTGEPVDPAQLDGQGRYRRVATGWGER
jgi:hypothetical protein